MGDGGIWSQLIGAGLGGLSNVFATKPKGAKYTDDYQEADRRRLMANQARLQSAAQGRTASTADIQSRQALSDQAAAAQSLAASARGSQLGLAQRAGAQAAGMNMGKVAKEGAFARGTEITQSREEAARALENIRTMDMQNAIDRAKTTYADTATLEQYNRDRRAGQRETINAVVGAVAEGASKPKDEEEE